MCGRYSLALSADEIAEVFEADSGPLSAVHEPRYNIAPTQVAPVVVSGAEGRRVGLTRWGLVPHWAEDLSRGGRMINARSETVLQRRAFREPFLSRRCLVPADGFYEWEDAPDPGSRAAKRKQPYWIHPVEGGILAMAGIWTTWTDGEGLRHPTFAILTRDAPEDLAWLHDRVPLILSPGSWEDWLARGTVPETLTEMIREAAHPHLKAHPVSPSVNRVENDDPSCIAPITVEPPPEPQQGSFL